MNGPQQKPAKPVASGSHPSPKHPRFQSMSPMHVPANAPLAADTLSVEEHFFKTIPIPFVIMRMISHVQSITKGGRTWPPL